MQQFINSIKTETGEQIQFIDARYYTKDHKVWYPGISEILNTVSKGRQYEQWLKATGFNADYLAKIAMEQGSNVHAAIQFYLQGNELSFGDINKPNYTRKEWEMVSKFVDFYEEFKPKTIEIEKVLVSDILKFGSQLDYVCELNKEIWIIDHKSGGIYDTAYMQVSAYVQLWNEYFPHQKAARAGILHLESTHRGRDKSGKSIQGKGWILIPVDDIGKHYEDFKHVHAIWQRANPAYVPFNITYPAKYSIG